MDKNKLTPSDVSVMKPEIKMKLNTKSIKYSLKFIIKGERNTGKSSLFNRLQGLQFKEQYTPTPEIQISHINWDYKNTDDIVDVEIWDIVDVATTSTSSSASSTLKTATKQQQQQQPNQNNNIDNNGMDQDKIEESFYDDDDSEQSFDPKLLMSSLNSLKNSGGKTGGSFKFGGLDSKTINVYKNVNAVIFMMDPSKRWTFKYVEKEFDKVPLDKHILLISNFRDKNPIGIGGANTVTSISSSNGNGNSIHSSKDSQIVTYGDIQSLINSRDNTVTHIEASMLNAYGLSNIVRFFNIPFLEAQKQSLIQQLQRNELELSSSKEELSLMIKESNYNNFIKRVPSSQPQPPPQQQSIANPPSPPSQQSVTMTQQQPSPQPTHQILHPSSPPPTTNSGSGSFFSRLFSKDPTSTTQSAAILLQQQQAQQQAQLLLQQEQQQQQPQTQATHKKVVLPTMPKVLSNIEEFVAGTNDDDDFYSEKTSKIAFIKNIIPTGKQAPVDRFGNDSDDDDDNPWVSKEEDDFYSTKTSTTQHKKQNTTSTPTKSKTETTTKPATPTTSKSSTKSQTTTPTTTQVTKQTSPKITPKSPSPTPTPTPAPIVSPKIVTPIAPVTTTSKVEKAFTEFNPFGESKVDFNDDESDDDDYKSTKTTNKSKPVKFNSDESDDDGFNPLVTKDMDYDDIPTTVSKSIPKPTTPKTISSLSSSPKLASTSPKLASTSPKTISPKLLSTSPKTTLSTSPNNVSPKPIVKKQQTPQIKQQYKFNSDDEDNDEKDIDYDDIKTNSPKIQTKQQIKFNESDSEDEDKSNLIVTKDDDYEDFF